MTISAKRVRPLFPFSLQEKRLTAIALWPLFHYLLWLDTTATLPAPDPSWKAYTTMNQLFADKVAQIYQPGDLIIVHDYHLLLAPKMIREALGQNQHQHGNGWGALQPSPAGQTDKRKGMDWEGEVTPSQARSKEQEESRLKKLGGFLGNAASSLGHSLGLENNQVHEIMIGMFMHTPWPSSEIFRCLPSELTYFSPIGGKRADQTGRREILEGMLGANIVMFQTYSYSRHFVSTCIRVCGFESANGGVESQGQFTAVGYCPIGIDIKRVSHDRDAPGVTPKMEALRMLYKDKKIIVGREKLDVAKGVYNKLQAFEKFLQTYPQWRGKVVLIQVTTPALSEHPKLERMCAELVSHINGTYGSLDFTPIHH